MDKFKKEGVIHEAVRLATVNHPKAGELNQPVFVGLYELRYEEEGMCIGWNVHLIKTRLNRFSDDPQETYPAQPSSGRWGQDAWSFYDRGRAERRFEELASGLYWQEENS